MEEEKESNKSNSKTYKVKLSLSFSRKRLMAFGFLVLLAVLVFVLYKTGYAKKAYNWGFNANVTVVITDSETKKGVEAKVKLRNIDKTSYQADVAAEESGQAKLVNKLVAGRYDLEVSLNGYYSHIERVELKRGDNTLNYSLKKIPPKLAKITGIVGDYVTEKPLSDITVSVDGKEAVTDKDGRYSIGELNVDKYQVKISTKGYLEYTGDIEIKDLLMEIEQIKLVPTGRVVFSSNRDGKRGIYTSNYDGSDQKPLIARVGEYEDYSPTLSPDQTKVAFLSNREGKRDENNNLIVKNYVVGVDGKGLTKISDEKTGNTLVWTKNSKKLLWSAQKNNISEMYVYDLVKKENNRIDDKNFSFAYLNEDGTKAAYSVYNNGSYGIYVWDIENNKLVNTVIETTASSYMVDFRGNNSVIYSSTPSGQSAPLFYSFNTANGTSEKITYEYPKRSYVKSNSGSYVAYIEDRDGKNNLFYAKSDYTGEKKLTSIDTANYPVVWSVGDKYLFFNSYKTGESALYIIGLDGGTAKKVVDISNDFGYR